MFLLKKVFQLRDKSMHDEEKPFLDHLEDLRIVITRIVITLIVAMSVCFTFQEDLMNLLRKPFDSVRLRHQESQIPATKEMAKPLDVEKWERAKKAERASNGLRPDERAEFFKLEGQELEFHAHTVALLRAALALPEQTRETFLASSVHDAEQVKQIKALIATKATPEIDQSSAKGLTSLKPTETFMLSMKLAFFAGIVLAFPLLLYFILQFILPGLHGNEKRVLWPALAIGFGLFLAGVSFAYFVVLPRTLIFFFEWSGKLGVENEWRIGDYMSFTTQFTLLFGAAFELPVVVMVLVKLGLLGYDMMKNTRSYAIVGILITAGVLTPTPDIMTQLLMAAPMIILYEICIWLAWWDKRKLTKLEAEHGPHFAPADDDDSVH